MLWGKSRGLDGSQYPLICHLLDAAAVMRVLWCEVISAGLRAQLAEQMGVTEENAGRLLEFWAGLHDIGKITPAFQRQVWVPPGYPQGPGDLPRGHDFAAHLWLASALRQAGYADERRAPVARLVAQLLGGHHGCFHSVDPGDTRLEKRPFIGIGNGPWDEQRVAAFDAVHTILDAPEPPPNLGGDTAAVACALIILSDWLASQISFVKRQLVQLPDSGRVEDLQSFFHRSLAQAPALLSNAGLTRLRLRAGTFGEEFPFEPNALQSTIAEELPALVTGPGLLMVAAPMGIGKTEVAFHAARIMGHAAGTSGIFVALPTMATADQMYERLAAYLRNRSLDPTGLTLLHGMAWLSPLMSMVSEEHAEGVGDITSEDDTVHLAVAEWLLGAKRGILAPAAVGTIDQALMAVLPVRHNVLRMLGLAQKTVIIDEVHAFSPYMRRLLVILLSWLGRLGAPVVLLSATLPKHVARELYTAYLGRAPESAEALDLAQHYPGWTYAQRDMPTPISTAVAVPQEDRRELAVTLRPVDVSQRDGKDMVDRMPALRDELRRLIDEGGCAAVICTTVDQAQETYRDLRAWFDQRKTDGSASPELRLLHSRFPVGQRARITHDVITTYGPNGDRRRPSVLVATQVIEQSLDIDFDLMISDLAPIELLLQRSGRAHRHKSNDASRPEWAATPRLVVLTAPGEDTPRVPKPWTRVYPHASLIRAQRLLSRREDKPISIPDDVQDLVDAASPGDGIGAPDPLLDGFESAEVERISAGFVEVQAAEMIGIATPDGLTNLYSLTDREITEELISTRFDADSERVLPYFIGEDGDYHLGGPDGPMVPVVPGAGRRFTREQCAEVINHTIPLRASLLQGRSEANMPPEAWSNDVHLRNLVLLPHRVDADGQPVGPVLGDQRLTLHLDVGLTTSF
ncbi:CRISPR-associated Cas3 family helicase [Murinocardiopsis flavida]|uniref:CRISPR-associated Cas3 family helicase n=1 Tax=Murinocardiopsis flavida TaxID=645275 RepID=A0A2P8CA91_9ACTN|nr:CRISPR-associated Cas3 family helicase [Murinocardiopsis flavida]